MTSIPIREAIAFDRPRVDRTKCVISGVRVLGKRSRNGRTYTDAAIDSGLPLYESARVYVDHPATESNARKLRERFGRLVNVRRDADGATADLRYNPQHPDTETILWYAENDPGEIGLSHNAEGNGRRMDDGTVLVERITKVHSVDLVDGPATTLSLYEQDQTMPDAVVDPAVAPAPAAGGDFRSKLADLAQHVVADPAMKPADILKKLKAIVGMIEAEAGPSDAPADEPKDDDEMMEQLRGYISPAVKRARSILLREKRRADAIKRGVPADAITDVFLEQLVAAPAADVAKLIDDRRTVAAKRPASAAPAPTDAGAPKDIKAITAELFG